jgi:hypothetical protein
VKRVLILSGIVYAAVFFDPTHILGVVGFVLITMRMTALMPFFAVFTR